MPDSIDLAGRHRCEYAGPGRRAGVVDPLADLLAIIKIAESRFGTQYPLLDKGNSLNRRLMLTSRDFGRYIEQAEFCIIAGDPEHGDGQYAR